MNKVTLLWGWIAILGLLSLTPWVAISQPLQDPPPQTSGRSGGSRGCDTKQATANVPALMLLTPNRTLAKTTAIRPTFAWFIGDATPQPLTFRVYQYEPTRQTVHLVVELRDVVSQPGIMVLSLPEPALSIGQRYLWQVELVCDPNHPSSNVFAEADVEVVAIASSLQTKLANATSLDDRITLYAEAGLWHDALRLALDRSHEKSTIDDRTLVLLRQIGVTDTELNSLKRSPIHQLHP